MYFSFQIGGGGRWGFYFKLIREKKRITTDKRKKTVDSYDSFKAYTTEDIVT